MNDRPLLDPDDESGGRLLGEIAEEIIRPPDDDDPDKPRDPGWLRWVKFLALILGAGLIIGFICGPGVYFILIWLTAPYSDGQSFLSSDPMSHLVRRSTVGGCVGGGIALWYVIRCLRKGVDP